MRTMSIRFRFTIALTLLGSLLFGGYGIFDYLRERMDLTASVDLEIRILGRSLEASIGNALRDRQQADVETTLRTLESLAPTVDVHVRELDGRAMQSHGAETTAAVDAMMANVAATRAEVVAFGDHEVVYGAPLRGDRGESLGTLAIVRPTTDLEDDLARTRSRLVVVVIAIVIALSLVGAFLITTHLSRPLANVLAGIRHVRDGDFHARVPIERRDEIGDLVAEFNAMVTDLESTRQRAQDATEARFRIERGLQLIDKMVTIGQLSAGLAHEIGSPLQVLRGRASAIAETTADADTRRHAQILVEQTDRISRIVEQLLTFGRRRPARIARCKLDEPVQTVIELLNGEARRRGVALAVEATQRAELEIDADADQVQQVVLNLVRNALAVTPRGGTITVVLEHRVDNPDSLFLIVRDTGPGISQDMQTRLFEPFFTTRASEGGTGLGLAVVRSIVTAHGGSIAVVSELGSGTEFTVAFPRRHEGCVDG